jgi:hypothetical protein
VGDQKNKLKSMFNINPAGKVGCIYVDRSESSLGDFMPIQPS